MRLRKKCRTWHRVGTQLTCDAKQGKKLNSDFARSLDQTEMGVSGKCLSDSKPLRHSTFSRSRMWSALWIIMYMKGLRSTDGKYYYCFRVCFPVSFQELLVCGIVHQTIGPSRQGLSPLSCVLGTQVGGSHHRK